MLTSSTKNLKRMSKMIGKLLLSLCIVFTSNVCARGCADFEDEAEAYDGLVPKFDENGKVRALIMYGEGTFLVAKRSLINDARRNAELKARRAYAEFLKSGFDSDTVAANIVNTKQLTDQSGNTSGTAEELSSTLDTMTQRSSETLSGIIKLDECVNTEEKYVLVQMGWKPATETAAADAKVTMANDDAIGDNAAHSKQSTPTTSKIQESNSYRMKSKLADDF